MSIEAWEITEAERYRKMSLHQLAYHIGQQRQHIHALIERLGPRPEDPEEAMALYHANRSLLAMEASRDLKRSFDAPRRERV